MEKTKIGTQSTENARLASGTRITCPGCGEALFEVAYDLFEEHILQANCFKPIGNTPEPVDGQEMRCYICHEYFTRQTERFGYSLHTDEGWK